MTCKWSMDEYTDWWAGCGEFLTAWTDKEPPRYCPYCGERVEVEKRQLAYVRTCRDVGQVSFKCSECDCELDLTDEQGEPVMWIDGKGAVLVYCPGCGAKVVEQ